MEFLSKGPLRLAVSRARRKTSVQTRLHACKDAAERYADGSRAEASAYVPRKPSIAARKLPLARGSFLRSYRAGELSSTSNRGACDRLLHIPGGAKDSGAVAHPVRQTGRNPFDAGARRRRSCVGAGDRDLATASVPSTCPSWASRPMSPRERAVSSTSRRGRRRSSSTASAKLEIRDGGVNIQKVGRVKSSFTPSNRSRSRGRAIAQGQEILYVTECCILRQEPEGVTVKASRLSERSARRTLSTGKMGLHERSSAADLTNREPTNGFWIRRRTVSGGSEEWEGIR